MSQPSSSQPLPDPDSAEWCLTNEQSLMAIDLREERVRDLAQTLQILNQQGVEVKLQRGQANVLSYTEGIQELDRQARQRWLDDAARRQSEKLAAVELRRNKLQGEKLEKEKIRQQDRQRLLDDDAAKRLEVRRVKAQLEAKQGERSRLNSLAIVQQTQETLRLRDEARSTKQRALRDEADMKARGRFKRPASTQEAIDPSPKRSLGSLDGRGSRYAGLVWF